MSWLAIIGFAALLSLVLSGALLVFLLRRKRDIRPLPDGDYIVSIIGVRESPRGVETTFKVDEPKELRGRTVTIVREKME